MAHLDRDDGDVAWDGVANFTIYPGGYPYLTGTWVELWERTVQFGGPVPDFAETWSGNNTSAESRPGLPLGGLHQVRLYHQGQGQPDGRGPVLSQLDFPVLARNHGEVKLIDQCQQAPQLDIAVGGTFAKAVVGVCPSSMVRIQFGTAPPHLHTYQLGIFGASETVAWSVADAPKNMHQLDILSRPSDDDEPLLPGNDYWWVALAWRERGRSTSAGTPASQRRPRPRRHRGRGPRVGRRR